MYQGFHLPQQKGLFTFYRESQQKIQLKTQRNAICQVPFIKLQPTKKIAKFFHFATHRNQLKQGMKKQQQKNINIIGEKDIKMKHLQQRRENTYLKHNMINNINNFNTISQIIHSSRKETAKISRLFTKQNQTEKQLKNLKKISMQDIFQPKHSYSIKPRQNCKISMKLNEVIGKCLSQQKIAVSSKNDLFNQKFTKKQFNLNFIKNITKNNPKNITRPLIINKSQINKKNRLKTQVLFSDYHF